MSSDLLSIAKSGATVARMGLDMTAQNIANVGTEGYVRRTVSAAEVAGSSVLYNRDVSVYGVRLAGMTRNADAFRTAEVRRTTGDLARADAELTTLTSVESALEQSHISNSLSDFAASIDGLKADPTNAALRMNVLEKGRSLAGMYHIASDGLDAAQSGLQAKVVDDVTKLNQLATNLASVNARLTRTGEGSSNQAALLDQRDLILKSMSEIGGVTVAFGGFQTAAVSIDGVTLVDVNGAVPLNATISGGSLTYDIGGTAVDLTGGSLAGMAQGLTQLTDARARLNASAAALIGAVNGAQAAGVALDGSAGQPLFSGTSAANIAMVATDPAALATAPAGSGANSRNAANLDAMAAAIKASGAQSGFEGLLTDISGAVAARGVTRDALSAVANVANAALDSQAGVSLDDEAANLLRYQQAFQASGQVMQTARDIFETIIAIH